MSLLFKRGIQKARSRTWGYGLAVGDMAGVVVVGVKSVNIGYSGVALGHSWHAHFL